MGIYDREYSRGPEPGFHLALPQTATIQIVLVTAAVYVAQLAFPSITEALSLKADWWRHPWEFYQLLTFGFLHDPNDIKHILFNMLAFWFFAREIEAYYGRGEFLTFYLTAIVIAGLAWSLVETALGSAEPHGINWLVDGTGRLIPVASSVPSCLGASGGIAAVFTLFALRFPHRQVLLYFVIPVPVWLLAIVEVAYDASGAIHRSGNVAFTAHLAGAAFGLAYYWFNWRLAPWVTRGKDWLPNRSKPRLRVVEPDDLEEEPDDLAAQVDAILEKIKEKGQDSLSWSERRLLERASREYRQKRK